MTWLKLPDDWANRPDIVALTAESFRLHVAGMSHSMKHLTDRVIARHVVGLLAPGYRPRMVEELVGSHLWLPCPDESGWWIADAAMDEQPTRDEVLAEREATAARQDLSRARKLEGEAAKRIAVAKAEQRADAARQAIARAKEEKRLHLGTAPWLRPAASPAPAPVTSPVPVPVTGAVTRDVTRDQQRESQRPDPTRPGEPTVLSGPEAGDLTAASGPVPSLAAMGVLPPPGHRGDRRLPPADDELAEQHAALLADPRCNDELRRNAVAQLRVMGREDLIPAGVNGR